MLQHAFMLLYLPDSPCSMQHCWGMVQVSELPLPPAHSWTRPQPKAATRAPLIINRTAMSYCSHDCMICEWCMNGIHARLTFKMWRLRCPHQLSAVSCPPLSEHQKVRRGCPLDSPSRISHSSNGGPYLWRGGQAGLCCFVFLVGHRCHRHARRCMSCSRHSLCSELGTATGEQVDMSQWQRSLWEASWS